LTGAGINSDGRPDLIALFHTPRTSFTQQMTL